MELSCKMEENLDEDFSAMVESITGLSNQIKDEAGIRQLKKITKQASANNNVDPDNHSVSEPMKEKKSSKVCLIY